MKKLLLSLFAVAIAVFTASAAEFTFDFVNNDYGMSRESGSSSNYNASPTTITEGAVTVTLEKTGGNGNRLWSDGLRFYKGGNTMTVSVSTGTISKIACTFKTDASAAYLTADGYADGTWTGSAQSVAFAVASTFESGSNIALKTLTITVDGDVTSKKNADMKFAAATAKATIGEAFTAPELTKETTAEITWTSSDEEVATVDATGAVTLVAAGTTTITAAAAENDDYYAGSASYTLKVVEPLPANVVYFALADENGAEGWTYDNEVLPSEITSVWSYAMYYDHGQLTGSAFNKVNYEALAYAVSPVINLAGRENCAVTFEHSCKYTDGLDLCGFVVREEGATEWTSLTVAEWPEGGTNDFIAAGDIDLQAYDGKKIQLAFKYASTAEGACTWRVRDIKVTGDQSGSAIEEIEAETEAPAVYYNLQGVRVANPENGIFIMVQGKKATKVAL